MPQTLTLELPSGLYTRIKTRAEQANRSVEDEILDLLATTIPPTYAEPADLQETLASLELLENEAVARAARNRIPAELAAELETLHLKQQREGLSLAESARCAELVRSYERAMLIRAQAAVLLKRRGIDISTLVATP